MPISSMAAMAQRLSGRMAFRLPGQTPPVHPSNATAAIGRRRRALGALAALSLVAGMIAGAGAGDDPATGSATAARAAPDKPPELPGGGRRLFPDRRVVAFYGSPRDPQLGALGVGSLRGAMARLRKQARGYARKTRPVLPALELISTLATAAPGPTGLYRDHLPAATIDRHLRVARANKALLLLDIQPGRGDFFSEVRRLTRWLREPDVGLALDPEWHVGPGQLPGKVIGSMTAQELNDVSAWLAMLVKVRKLPEKLLVVHQFTNDMVRDKQLVLKRPGLALTFNVDGFGTQSAKKSKFRDFTSETVRFHNGFKLFYEEDTNIMRPRQVMALLPRPDLVVYE
jgi:hypothetical protein